MQLIQHPDEITAPFKSGVITIGNFDGVHIGHQALFYEVIERAHVIDGTSIAMTFEPHPLRVLKKNHTPPLITLLEQKVELIERSGVDVLICVPFTLEFAAITALSFVEDLLVRKIGMKAIVLGEDYAFGKNREGNIKLLSTLAPRLGFEVIVTSLIRSVQGVSERISSTAIRELVQAGEMQQACKMLGRHFQLRGIVVPGRDRGRETPWVSDGQPQDRGGALPQNRHLRRHGGNPPMVSIWGLPTSGTARPSTTASSPWRSTSWISTEAIYGEKIRVNFVKRLRGEIKFAGIEALKNQIGKDIEAARRILMVGSLAGRA